MKKVNIWDTFIKEWTPQLFKTVEKGINNWMNSRYFETLHDVNLWSCKTFNQHSDALGLAYTSSSMCAMYSICNTELYFDAAKVWKVEHFCLGAGGFVYVICNDKDENELIFNIN